MTDANDIIERLRDWLGVLPRDWSTCQIVGEAADLIESLRAELAAKDETIRLLDAAIMESSRRWLAGLPAQFVRKDGRRQTVEEIMAENDALQHDIARCVQRNSDLLAENEALRRARDGFSDDT